MIQLTREGRQPLASEFLPENTAPSPAIPARHPSRWLPLAMKVRRRSRNLRLWPWTDKPKADKMRPGIHKRSGPVSSHADLYRLRCERIAWQPAGDNADTEAMDLMAKTRN
jgi:hypothetical protein